MKKVLFSTFLLLATTVVFSQTKVGTIDVNYIMSKMPELQSINDSLVAYGNRLDNQINLELDLYQQKLEDYQKNMESYTQEVLQEKQLEILNLESNIAKLRQNAIQLIQIREDELSRPLYEKIGKSLQKVAQAGNYTQVLATDQNSNVVFIDDNYDLTLQVMQDLGLPLD